MDVTAGTILILGSGPGAVAARDWTVHAFDAVVAINNAWRIRPDWTHHIYPEDFPAERCPDRLSAGQRSVTYEEYVPCQNRFGGVVYAGGTMAFTTGYWALALLQPRVMAFLGCDMVYPATGPTHFYGTGTADPLRVDPTLRSLEAKAARLSLLAAKAGCRCVNLSQTESRLVFPRAGLGDLAALAATPPPPPAEMPAVAAEREAGFFVASGRYWETRERFDLDRIDAIDRLWLDSLKQYTALTR